MDQTTRRPALATILAHSLIGALVLLAIASVALPRGSGQSLRSVPDATSLITLLAALMGGIFVAGGLVVALAAVVTLLSIDERVAKGVKEGVEKLLPGIMADANAQMQAYLQMREARDATDWRAAEGLIESALAKYPKLPGARRQLALQFMAAIERDFALDHSASVPPSARQDVPLTTATIWIDRARDEGEDQDGQLLASLAVIAGLERQPELMLDRLSAAVPTWAGYLAKPDRLAMLAHACVEQSDAMDRLGTLVGREVPLSPATVAATLQRLGDELGLNASERHLRLYAIGKPGMWPGVAREQYPVGIWFGLRPTTPRGAYTGHIRAVNVDPAVTPDEFKHIQNGPWRTLDEVRDDLLRLCWVIVFDEL